MPGDEKYREFNRDLWDKRVRAHLRFELYPSAAVEAGTYTVPSVEIAEMGDVRGKRLLHLQCNGGADTLFWARQGASVVGVDFSPPAIDEARRLAALAGADAEFICADIFEPISLERGQVDIVYTSTGVLWWLSDLTKWAEVIAHHLKPGGFFYIHEIHPFSMVLGDNDGRLTIAGDYFVADQPLVYDNIDGTYYEAGPDFESEAGTECGWIQTLGDVITALAVAGLRIDFLHEYDAAQFRMLQSFVSNNRGEWRPKGAPKLPLTFSLKATKP